MTDRPGPRLVSRDFLEQHQAQIDRECFRENVGACLLILAIVLIGVTAAWR